MRTDNKRAATKLVGILLLTIAIAITLVVPCDAATKVQVTRQSLTATQAIVRVTTDQAGFCTYRVSEGAGFTSMVNDVNPLLFAGANSDARPGAIVTGLDPSSLRLFNQGTEHIFVAGTRTSSRAADGKLYSRALQANTLHWVGVTCGSDAEVSTVFQTLNPPLGNAEPETMPFDATAFGNVAVPSVNWQDRAVVYNDMHWGTQLHRASDASDVGFYAGANTFAYALNGTGHWTNPNNAMSASSGSLAVCDTSSSCTTSDALGLVVVISGATTNFKINAAWDPSVAFTDFLVRMWGSGTDSSSANRTVAVCWSIDDQTCFTASQNIVLPQSSPAFAGTAPQSWSVQGPWSGINATKLTNILVSGGVATVNFAAAHGLSPSQQICINGIRNAVNAAQGGNGLNGCHIIASTPSSNSLTFPSNAVAATYTDSELIASPGFPQSQWMSWGTPPLHNSVGTRGGGTVAATSGRVVLTSNGGSYSNFDINWTPGTKIFIAGSSPTCSNNLCTIASIIDVWNLALVENLTISGANWGSANFALLIKKTTGTGAVSVSAGYDFVFSAQFSAGLDGSGNICNSNYVTVSVDANGSSIAPVQGLVCVMSASGVSQATTPIYLFIPSTGETRLIARNYQASVNDYTQWIGWHPSNGAAWFTHSGGTVSQAVYGGDFRALTPGYPQLTTEPGTPEQLTFTNIFSGSGTDIISQIANCQANGKCNSGINASVFGVPPSPPQTGAAIQGNYMELCGSALGTTQDGPGYVTMWDISTIPSTLAWAGYTFDAFPVGYGGIHSCLSFGNGAVNAVFINGSGGQVGGNFRGPWQQTPTMYDGTGTGYTSNTSVSYTDGFDCPAGLSAPWQALGAKPVASGGVARCLKFKVPGDFCSVNAALAEATAFPCPWSINSTHSLIKAIGEGDELSDSTYGANSFGEKMLVVKVVRNSTTDIDLTVFRYGSQIVAPNSNFTCGTYGPSEWNHANGWTMYAMPYHVCTGTVDYSNAADSTHTFIPENQNLIGAHSDFGPGQGAGNYTFVEGASLACASGSCYNTRTNQPLPAQIGQPITNQVNANASFGSSQLPDIYLQSYPSKRQQSSLSPPNEMNWALDVRHYNPGGGNQAETAEGLFGNTVTRVGSCAQTYLITFAGSQIPDPKVAGFVGWAGYHMLADASAPGAGSVCMDSIPWHYCYAYNAGECVAGSSQGSMYVSVPLDATNQACLVNSYVYNSACIGNQYPYGFWVTQFLTNVTDTTGAPARRLTSAFVAPGRQYNFTNAKATPDAKWVQVMASWLEGQRTDLFWVKLPPFPARTSNPGILPGATGLNVLVTGSPGDAVRVAFGYAENGPPSSFFCTSRQEACFTPSSAPGNGPFVYASEPQSFTSCQSNCLVHIPGMPGRIVYYQVQRKNGSNVTASGMGAIAVQ